LAAYYVHWTVGKLGDHGAIFDLIVGRWGNRATAADRHLVSLDFRVRGNGPAFMVIDAGGRPVNDPAIVGWAMTRAEVLGTPAAKQAFEIVDAILAQDNRLSKLVS
jgi:hypothetical protein